MAAGATGTFREQYAESTDSVIEVLEQNESVMDGEVLWAGVVGPGPGLRDGHRGHDAAPSPTTRPTTSRWPATSGSQLELVAEKGEWLTSNLEFVAMSARRPTRVVGSPVLARRATARARAGRRASGAARPVETASGGAREPTAVDEPTVEATRSEAPRRASRGRWLAALFEQPPATTASWSPWSSSWRRRARRAVSPGTPSRDDDAGDVRRSSRW